MMRTAILIVLLLVLHCAVAQDGDKAPFKSEPMVPPGNPQGYGVDLTRDGIPEVIVNGYINYMDSTGTFGYYVRGITPAPGVAILMVRTADGTLDFFRLVDGTALTPERLATGLQNGSLIWVDPARETPLFFPVLKHSFGLDEPMGWRPAAEKWVAGDLVYRSKSKDGTVIGVVEISFSIPAGRLGVNQQTFVPEGEVLRVY